MGTKEHIADVFTKASCTAQPWSKLCHLAQIGPSQSHTPQGATPSRLVLLSRSGDSFPELLFPRCRDSDRRLLKPYTMPLSCMQSSHSVLFCTARVLPVSLWQVPGIMTDKEGWSTVPAGCNPTATGTAQTAFTVDPAYGNLRSAQSSDMDTSSDAAMQHVAAAEDVDMGAPLISATSDAGMQHLATQARFVFVECQGELRWALDHDKACAPYKAQVLAECLLQSLIEIGMMLPQEDFRLAYLIGWVTSTLDDRDTLPVIAEDIANILGALDFMWPHKEVWPEERFGDWNMGIDIDGSFIFPAATSIFVYRKASPGDKDVCACADAAGVKESGLHVWLYVHEDRGYSNGPPMLRCTHGQGTLPDERVECEGAYFWNLSKPAKICANRLRCKQCGLHQQLKHFARARDGTEPKIDITDVERLARMNADGDDDREYPFPEFCTVLCNFCKEQLFACSLCKYPRPREEYRPPMWKHRFERGATCTLCEAESHLHCQQCGHEIGEEKLRCHECGKLKVRKEYSASMWHNKSSTDRTIVCLECEAQTPTVKCDICNTSKPVEALPASALRHSSTQTTRCYDCSHPPCMFLPQCPTCTQCRSTTCKDPRCREAPETVPSEHLTASVEDVKNFACERCEYLRCIGQHDGTVCGKERRRQARAQARRNKTAYRCGDCQTWLLSQQSLQEAAAPSRRQ